MVDFQSIGLEQARLKLDTGATQTIIDKNFLIIIGYDLSSPIDIKEFETAGDIITAEKHIFMISDYGICSSKK